MQNPLHPFPMLAGTGTFMPNGVGDGTWWEGNLEVGRVREGKKGGKGVACGNGESLHCLQLSC